MATTIVASRGKHHDYAIDAACLLETCLARLRETISLDRKERHDVLVNMQHVLVTTERLLLAYLCQQIEMECGAEEEEEAPSAIPDDRHDSERSEPLTLSEGIQMFQAVLEEKKKRHIDEREPNPSSGDLALHERDANELVILGGRNGDKQRLTHSRRSNSSHGNGTTSSAFHHSRSPVDSLLFRLIVILQLSIVRIDDAQLAITGRRRREPEDFLQYPESGSCSTVLKVGLVSATACVLGIGSFWMMRSQSGRCDSYCTAAVGRSTLQLSGKVALAALAGRLLVREWGIVWMKTKLVKSTADVQEWQRQWLLVQRNGQRRSSFTSTEKSQRLIQDAMSQSPKLSLWHSEGEIRFLLLKRAMDLLYASVGTAVEATKNTEATRQGKIGWKLPIAAAAAASYYSLIDPSQRASEAVSSSAFDLIQYAWGMVSLPAIKQLSLRASRLLKGAAIAERVTIAGVPCFILSRDHSSDLAAALMREKRRKRKKRQSALSTIHETAEEVDDGSSSPLLIRRRAFPKRDVILHFTGGGFFAHTLASDIPFLLDWSGMTNAVVVCPEYSLLPEHTFPVALNQVTQVYCSLVTGESSELLGITADRIIVTGESAGGNLAVAMCVKLCMDTKEVAGTGDIRKVEENVSDGTEYTLRLVAADDGSRCNNTAIRLPHAIMLSCPALNLTLDLSPSRVVGQQDPVLPSGLITAISDAYAPSLLGIDKINALVSPLYASDDILRLFPPILLFASSNDPLLDDAVDFNARCCSLGVDSQLGAVSHMPHAYWGLGTAGFPEAQQVQQECQEWLVRQFDNAS